MNTASIIIVCLILAALYLNFFANQKNRNNHKVYRSQHRQYFMSAVENRFYHILMQVVGHKYYIFAQVHLPTIVDHKVIGQNWKAAFRHIDEKSVDFVLCDKFDISPKLAIELDDSSHNQPARQERDAIVDRVLSEAGLPLLRVRSQSEFEPDTILQNINDILIPSSRSS
jgi:very-short-patch-repair endonuclease